MSSKLNLKSALLVLIAIVHRSNASGNCGFSWTHVHTFWASDSAEDKPNDAFDSTYILYFLI